MIIGLLGNSGAGKDTSALALAMILGGSYRIKHFADPIKEICASVYKFSWRQLHGDEKNLPDKRYPREAHTFVDGRCVVCFSADKPGCYLTPRYAFQTCGDSFGRACYDKTWVDLLVRAMGDNCIVADVRRGNEVAAIKREGGVIIKIDRKITNAYAHPSETDVSGQPWDYLVRNNGTKAELFERLLQLCTDERWIGLPADKELLGKHLTAK
jgi:hypothetical protein